MVLVAVFLLSEEWREQVGLGIRSPGSTEAFPPALQRSCKRQAPPPERDCQDQCHAEGWEAPSSWASMAPLSGARRRCSAASRAHHCQRCWLRCVGERTSTGGKR